MQGEKQAHTRGVDRRSPPYYHHGFSLPPPPPRPARARTVTPPLLRAAPRAVSWPWEVTHHRPIWKTRHGINIERFTHSGTDNNHPSHADGWGWGNKANERVTSANMYDSALLYQRPYNFPRCSLHRTTRIPSAPHTYELHRTRTLPPPETFESAHTVVSRLTQGVNHGGHKRVSAARRQHHSVPED